MLHLRAAMEEACEETEDSVLSSVTNSVYRQCGYDRSSCVL